jgi:probable phosphoglycerate mutase
MTTAFISSVMSTVLSAEDAFAGETNVALSEEGRAQARSLSERLARETIAGFYASPMDRTMETARIVAEPHGLEVVPGGVSGRRGRLGTRGPGVGCDPVEESARGGRATAPPLRAESGLAVTARGCRSSCGSSNRTRTSTS